MTHTQEVNQVQLKGQPVPHSNPTKGKWKGRKVIYFDSSGGSGHKQVASALGANEKNRFDVLMDLVGKIIGSLAVRQWNAAKQSGDVEAQKQLVNKQGIADVVFAPAIFVNTLLILLREKPTILRNTQVTGLDSICRAIRLYNGIASLFKRPPCKLEIWMTDLPTDKATHFLSRIKNLHDSDREIVDLYAPDPLLDKGVKTEKEFWKKHAKLSLDQVHIMEREEIPVRAAFKEVDRTQFAPGKACALSLKLASPNAAQLLDFLPQDRVAINQEKSQCDLNLREGDFLWPVIIGSNPPESAIMSYIDAFIAQAIEQNQPGRRFYMIPFCGQHVDQSSLFQKVCQKLKEKQNVGELPENICIVPSSFQNAEVIAQTSFRADVLTTGAGGSSSFEHLVMSEVFPSKHPPLIHSEAPTPHDLAQLLRHGPEKGRFKGMTNKKNQQFYDEMKKMEGDPEKIAVQYFEANKEQIVAAGIPVWELGNAQYLEEKIDAKIVSQASIRQNLKEAMSSRPVSEEGTTDISFNTLEGAKLLDLDATAQIDLKELQALTKILKKVAKETEGISDAEFRKVLSDATTIEIASHRLTSTNAG